MSKSLNPVFALLVLLCGATSAQDAETFRQYQFAPGDDGQALVLRELPMPTVGPGEVMVRIRATSLNRRDIYISTVSAAVSPGPCRFPTAPGKS